MRAKLKASAEGMRIALCRGVAARSTGAIRSASGPRNQFAIELERGKKSGRKSNE